MSYLTRKRVECKPSAVANHLLLHNQRDNNGFRPLLKESILISRDSPVLNKNTASILLLLLFD